MQRGLGEECNRAMEEVIPRLVLKLGEEEVSDCVREMAQRFQDHTGQERKFKITFRFIPQYIGREYKSCKIIRYVYSISVEYVMMLL